MTAHDPDHQKVACSSRMDGVCVRVCAERVRVRVRVRVRAGQE